MKRGQPRSNATSHGGDAFANERTVEGKGRFHRGDAWVSFHVSALGAWNHGGEGDVFGLQDVDQHAGTCWKSGAASIGIDASEEIGTVSQIGAALEE